MGLALMLGLILGIPAVILGITLLCCGTPGGGDDTNCEGW